jgi:hypothetical protein
VAEEHTAEKIAQLQRENAVLKKEIDRLRQLLEVALSAANRQAAPLLTAELQSPAPKGPDAMQESRMGVATHRRQTSVKRREEQKGRTLYVRFQFDLKADIQSNNR